MMKVIPILRIFDYEKAMEFYIRWLGFKIDWEHGLPNTPVYLQISRGDIMLHLSEHHGDGSPGVRVFIDHFPDLDHYHKGLLDLPYKYNRPGIHAPFYDPDAWKMTVTDPFGNRLSFVEREVTESK